MLLGIQILGLLFAIVMIYLTFIHSKKKNITVREYFFWLCVWIVFIIVTLFPNITSPFLETLNVARIMDLFVVLGFAFIAAFLFKNYITMRKMQKKIENLVRKIAHDNS